MKSALLLPIVFFALHSSVIAQAPMPASATVVEQAYAKAGKEHKKVLLIFHASWCGWCRKMERSLDDPQCKQAFDDNYVVTYLDVLESKGKENLENPGSLDLLKQYKADKAGLPFWLVLDADGKVLADARVRPAGAGPDEPGKNTGCPAQPNEVAYFIQVLKNTSAIDTARLSVIGKRFSENAIKH